jgi:hypothetical protein
MRAARTIAGGYQEGRPMIQIRKSEARGHANHGWLDLDSSGSLR